MNYTVEHAVITIKIQSTERAVNGDVIDLELKKVQLIRCLFLIITVFLGTQNLIKYYSFKYE